MARGAGSRSQRQASQSQPSQSQNSRSHYQRNARRRADDDEEEEEVEEEEERDDAMDEDGDGDEADLNRKANDLVRLALFTEYKRTPLRRDEISKKVMGSKSRNFREVFARAQQILNNTFGMQLVELQNRAPDEPEQKQDAAQEKAQEKGKEKKEKKNAVGVKKKAAPTGTKTYILRSMLDPQLIQIASTPDADLLRLEKKDLAANIQNSVDDDENATEPTGAIFAWERGDQLQSVGLLYVVLSLILVHGRAIADGDLQALLHRLRLRFKTQAPRDSRSTVQQQTVEQFLSTAIRQGYLDRQQIGDTKGAKKKRGRAAATQGANDDTVIFEWRWGPRAMAEVGEQDVARFVADFMVERTRGDVDDDEEENDVREDPETKRMREGMMKGIERAAGGNLAELM